METGPLVSVDWLAGRLDEPDLRVVDATWYMPAENRPGLAEFEQAHIPGAVFFDIDQIADRLEEAEVAQRRRQGAVALVHRDLADPGVDVHLRLDCDEPLAIAARIREPRDLNVLEDPLHVAVIGVHQRVIDGP